MKPRLLRAARVPGGQRIFQRMFTRLGGRGRPLQFLVEFYPYANLSHTIRLEEDRAHVRLSDVLRGAPSPVLEAAAALLLARLLRRRAPRKLAETYRHFSMAPRTRRRLARLRRRRGRRIKMRSRCDWHNLDTMFGSLNRRYFAAKLRRPQLGWSLRTWRAQLGSFDPALDRIILNGRLDRRNVPRFVVEYVLYHEMLHVKHPVKLARCGLQRHSPSFRREEKRFARYDRARRFLERLS